MAVVVACQAAPSEGLAVEDLVGDLAGDLEDDREYDREEDPALMDDLVVDLVEGPAAPSWACVRHPWASAYASSAPGLPQEAHG